MTTRTFVSITCQTCGLTSTVPVDALLVSVRGRSTTLAESAGRRAGGPRRRRICSRADLDTGYLDWPALLTRDGRGRRPSTKPPLTAADRVPGARNPVIRPGRPAAVAPTLNAYPTPPDRPPPGSETVMTTTTPTPASTTADRRRHRPRAAGRRRRSRVGVVVAVAMVTGLVTALVLVLVVFAGAGESVITGVGAARLRPPAGRCSRCSRPGGPASRSGGPPSRPP